MSLFRLHRGWREPNGLVTDHVTSGQAITAASAYEAMAAALAEGDFLVTDDTNLVWLTNEQDVLVWSLRLDDEDIQTEPAVP
ncbi:MAG: hypothetical protein MIN69_13780 [Methylorubrum extorquens]|jgi:hypothetical protein|uniref:hypothetical protein n=1 Tax=Methylorubrum extorquens TaxID=408 RepID=UPI002FEE02CD